MATDVARLVMQFEAPGARRLQNTLSSIQTGATKLTAATDAQVAAQYRLNSSFRAAQASSRSMIGAFRVQKGAVQQAGYQIGDFAVQVGSGQSAMVAFSQQASQLAGILGPGGAVLGAVIAIGGAIGGAMFRGMMDGKTATDELESAMDILSETIERTDNGSFNLTERIRELAKVSRVAAQLELQRGLIAARDAANSAREAIEELTDSELDTTILGDFEGAISQAERLERMGISVSDAFEQAGGSSVREFRDGLALIRDEAENLNDEFGISEESARELISSLAKSRLDPTVEGFQQLQESLFNASQSGANAEFVKLASNLSGFASEAVNAINRGEELNDIIKDFDAALKESDPELTKRRDKIREMVEAAEQQAATIGLSARATATYEAALAGANAEQIQAIDAAYRRIEAHKAEVEQQKRLQEQYKITAANDPLLQRQAADSRGKDLIASLREEAEATRRSLDERYAAQQEYRRKVMQIDDMMRLGVIENEQQKNALLAQARKQHLEQMTAIDGGYWERWMQASRENLENFSQLSQSVIGNFTSGFGDAFEAIVLDTKDAESAFKELGVSMVRSVVNAIGQMIAQWIALQAVQLALGTTATAATVTQAGTAAAAWAPAAALASLATSGANAAPAAAALTSTTALSQTLALAGGPSFEGGGYTGSGSRTGGVDGKGGFPAILHPNETVIDHTKVGDSGGTSNKVDQTLVFQISGGGDERKMQEAIMKAMPVIREQAKIAVTQGINQGGSLSRAVGRRP